MKIYLKSNYGYELHIEADNVHISEDIETREYPKTPEGKSDFSLPPKRDIDGGFLHDFMRLLEDIVYYRKQDIDSTDLIKILFSRLPQEKAYPLAKRLLNEYEPEVEEPAIPPQE